MQLSCIHGIIRVPPLYVLQRYWIYGEQVKDAIKIEIKRICSYALTGVNRFTIHARGMSHAKQ
jgi:hypothetical protein